MRVLIVSGIWPPDVGGPASHAPDVAGHLAASHEVTVVTTADRPPAGRPYRVRFTSRGLPTGVRHVVSLAEIARRAAAADVIYSTGMFARSAIASRLVGTPLVVKLTGDPAFERLRARGEFHGDVEDFAGARSPRADALRRLRDLTVRRASAIVCPSSYIRDLAIAWGIPADRVSVVPNPAPDVGALAGREQLRHKHGMEAPTVLFAGRLTAQKDLGTLLEAVARDGDAPSVVIVGDGPEREPLEVRARELDLGERVAFWGPRPRGEVLELMRAAEATVLPSAWENFPHSVVESLAVGTPVVASRTGGVAEVVTDGHNGLLLDPSDPDALSGALRRVVREPELVERLRGSAPGSVDHLAAAALYGDIENLLEQHAA